MFKLLIFDLDGTLIDSARDIADSLNELLARHDKPLQPYPVVVSHIGEGLRQLLFDLFPENDPGKTDLGYEEFLEIYGQNLLKTTQVYPGVQTFLKQWEGSMAVVTNKPIRFTEQVMQGLGLHQLPWTCVFGADSLARKKPDPLPLIEVMKAANCQPHETVMVGDGAPDVKAALAAGATSLGVGFGYTPPSRLLELGAHDILPHYDKLSQTLSDLFKVRFDCGDKIAHV